MTTTSRKRGILIYTDANGDKIGVPVAINIREVADIVHSFGQDLKGYGLEPEPGEDEVYGDIRVQVHDGGWSYHTGSSQFDQDHRGLWGSASVPAGCSRKLAREIAIDLIEDIE